MAYTTIQNKKLLLEVSSKMGASITKFIDKEKNKNIFRSFPKNKKISKYNCYYSGYFATIPYFGAIHKNTFPYKNKFISLPNTHIMEPDTIHGEGWVNKWDIKNITKNSLELNFLHNGKKSFPYKYKCLQKFSLTKDSLIIKVIITNNDKKSFYCGIGFHPWFSISKQSKIFSNTFLHLKQKKNKKFSIEKMLNTKALDLNKTKIDETFLKWDGRSKLILNKDIILEIINKKNVDNLHVYSPPKENFFCVEPVTNVRDAYLVMQNSKTYHGLKLLKMKKSFEASVEFKIIN